ncbi:DUF4242 domain-containing protein [Ramlibacter tataouinensis]|uniref:DUF4242 domain-containing protein n=1 Tax=Ramlibacter tataouinensis TaxID=94132 RepID=UPI0022F3FEE8|nr:DUF4242 domain-containing protein [Ramlibacter tataouinensis]WBY02023.1 DUF4242 domain-containing protein [Ramlibacter tataouinensis]
MPRYLIERDIPGIGQAGPRELKALALKSARVLRQLGPEIQWVHSYVAGDRIYCVYLAANEDLLREHARLGEFPISRISRVATVMDPTLAE